VSIVLLMIPTPAAAQSSSSRQVQRYLERGLKFFQQHDYERAIEQFRRGYEIEPRRELLFAMAQAERLSGDCPSALVYYQSFLSRNPPAKQAEAARENAELCRRALSAGPDGRARYRPSTPGPSTNATRSDVVTRGPAAALPWYRDRWTTGLLGGTAIAGTLSVGLLVGARSANQEAQSAGTYGAYDGALASARHRRRWGILSAVAATGLAAAAVYRLVRRRPSTTAMSIAATPGGGVAVGFAGAL
jgi:tetratricopeptide (TPR) repeat protein